MSNKPEEKDFLESLRENVKAKTNCEHHNRPRSLFCFNCSVSICPDCVQSHHNHSNCDKNKFIEEEVIEENISTNIESFASCETAQLKELQGELNEKLVFYFDLINSTVDDLKRKKQVNIKKIFEKSEFLIGELKDQLVDSRVNFKAFINKYRVFFGLNREDKGSIQDIVFLQLFKLVEQGKASEQQVLEMINKMRQSIDTYKNRLETSILKVYEILMGLFDFDLGTVELISELEKLVVRENGDFAQRASEFTGINLRTDNQAVRRENNEFAGFNSIQIGMAEGEFTSMNHGKKTEIPENTFNQEKSKKEGSLDQPVKEEKGSKEVVKDEVVIEEKVSRTTKESKVNKETIIEEKVSRTTKEEKATKKKTVDKPWKAEKKENNETKRNKSQKVTKSKETAKSSSLKKRSGSAIIKNNTARGSMQLKTRNSNVTEENNNPKSRSVIFKANKPTLPKKKSITEHKAIKQEKTAKEIENNTETIKEKKEVTSKADAEVASIEENITVQSLKSPMIPISDRSPFLSGKGKGLVKTFTQSSVVSKSRIRRENKVIESESEDVSNSDYSSDQSDKGETVLSVKQSLKEGNSEERKVMVRHNLTGRLSKGVFEEDASDSGDEDCNRSVKESSRRPSIKNTMSSFGGGKLSPRSKERLRELETTELKVTTTSGFKRSSRREEAENKEPVKLTTKASTEIVYKKATAKKVKRRELSDSESEEGGLVYSKIKLKRSNKAEKEGKVENDSENDSEDMSENEQKRESKAEEKKNQPEIEEKDALDESKVSLNVKKEEKKDELCLIGTEGNKPVCSNVYKSVKAKKTKINETGDKEEQNIVIVEKKVTNNQIFKFQSVASSEIKVKESRREEKRTSSEKIKDIENEINESFSIDEVEESSIQPEKEEYSNKAYKKPKGKTERKRSLSEDKNVEEDRIRNAMQDNVLLKKIEKKERNTTETVEKETYVKKNYKKKLETVYKKKKNKSVEKEKLELPEEETDSKKKQKEVLKEKERVKEQEKEEIKKENEYLEEDEASDDKSEVEKESKIIDGQEKERKEVTDKTEIVEELEVIEKEPKDPVKGGIFEEDEISSKSEDPKHVENLKEIKEEGSNERSDTSKEEISKEKSQIYSRKLVKNKSAKKLEIKTEETVQKANSAPKNKSIHSSKEREHIEKPKEKAKTPYSKTRLTTRVKTTKRNNKSSSTQKKEIFLETNTFETEIRAEEPLKSAKVSIKLQSNSISPSKQENTLKTNIKRVNKSAKKLENKSSTTKKQSSKLNSSTISETKTSKVKTTKINSSSSKLKNPNEDLISRMKVSFNEIETPKEEKATSDRLESIPSEESSSEVKPLGFNQFESKEIQLRNSSRELTDQSPDQLSEIRSVSEEAPRGKHRKSLEERTLKNMLLSEEALNDRPKEESQEAISRIDEVSCKQECSSYSKTKLEENGSEKLLKKVKRTKITKYTNTLDKQLKELTSTTKKKAVRTSSTGPTTQQKRQNTTKKRNESLITQSPLKVKQESKVPKPSFEFDFSPLINDNSSLISGRSVIYSPAEQTVLKKNSLIYEGSIVESPLKREKARKNLKTESPIKLTSSENKKPGRLSVTPKVPESRVKTIPLEQRRYSDQVENGAPVEESFSMSAEQIDTVTSMEEPKRVKTRNSLSEFTQNLDLTSKFIDEFRTSIFKGHIKTQENHCQVKEVFEREEKPNNRFKGVKSAGEVNLTDPLVLENYARSFVRLNMFKMKMSKGDSQNVNSMVKMMLDNIDKSQQLGDLYDRIKVLEGTNTICLYSSNGKMIKLSVDLSKTGISKFLSGSRSVLHKNNVYILGGRTLKGDSRLVLKYDIAVGKVSLIRRMNESRSYFSLFCVEDKIFVVGGLKNKTIEYFDCNAEEWTVVGLMRVKRANPSLYFHLNRELFVIGGNVGSLQEPEYTDKIESLWVDRPVAGIKEVDYFNRSRILLKEENLSIIPLDDRKFFIYGGKVSRLNLRSLVIFDIQKKEIIATDQKHLDRFKELFFSTKMREIIETERA